MPARAKRVADGEGRVVRSESEKFLPEVFLELPDVCGLPALKVVRCTHLRFGKKWG
jgi:hypothetical protein